MKSTPGKRRYFALILGGWFGGCIVTPAACGVPPPLLEALPPSVSKAKIDTYWLAPYVRASDGFGGATVCWYDERGSVKKQTAVASIVEPGFVLNPGPGETYQGVNEDWKITLPPDPPSFFASRYNMSGYITSTRDSRVFVHEFYPKSGQIALDIYVHGKRAPTIGPLVEYHGAAGLDLNYDGSTALVFSKDESHAAAQVIVTDSNGAVSFRTDCGSEVIDPIVAPNGAGVLIRPNGSDNHILTWFTREGKIRALDLSPNPRCVGWIPKSCQSLFETSVGYAGRYRLIDWNTGKNLWEMAPPGGGKILAIGFTPTLILFSMAESSRLGSKDAGFPVDDNGNGWIRAFYAVSVPDGSIVARWQSNYSMPLSGTRDSFLRLGDKLFYLNSDEFAELNLADIAAKANGWH